MDGLIGKPVRFDQQAKKKRSIRLDEAFVVVLTELE